ncbi:NAD(P)H-hydrate dehydratase [Lactobacillus taiwanensis]|uniref:NAD(P)H-hydrate dehydratase n=1 Tax=Lactobacillus taiwanensis TaxID=508451 RepID=UPI000B99416A|nr:NAD(P)H-hydrate dehydratase [Lactobacillus taiwanensis]OYS19421.1 NAD(P)H-hydrate dehydratase [Lactobacillus taiwanensis]OYS22669.1 NAD(P)H-hydrate dehydratase [Lactobacillus taiwanensis]OYS25951.1 NAD(P)H-hydrate dehydratase [Lactobacillus taiwanensis]OYS26619.1 NAD(P)H-hydrate dehydratase [Lactobacillus taiwanensis]OYS27623.1 NAD(P)H-hydrate dehydratase [Lactobacillus taiwanensis]
MESISQELISRVIKKRKSATHKGNYGRLLLIGGSKKYGGALIMAAEGALNSGAGLVTVATDQVNIAALHTRDPEIMALNWDESIELKNLIKSSDVVICGMGLGLDEKAEQILRLVRDNISLKQTLILDASALDLIGQQNDLLPLNSKVLIFTPHQMEWERLSGIKISDQNDELNQAGLNKLVKNKNAILVLKSNHTKVYDQAGHIYLNPFGNPGMAIGGMGDTLAGTIGGFCGQFTPNLETVAAAVGIHSLAADKIAERQYIIRPTQLSAHLPEIMKQYEK